MKYLMITMLVLLSCSENTTPLFKVGDCIQDSKLLERWENAPRAYKILEIGRKQYLYEFAGYKGIRLQDSFSISFIDNTSKKIPCLKELQ